MYFHNLGESTSITTGVSKSLSVSIDFDNSDEAHKYLLNLLLGDIYLTNSQFIKLDIRTISKTTGKHITVSGKATINFKNHFPSGNADEIQKLEFDIFPQDNKWTTEEVDDTPDNWSSIKMKLDFLDIARPHERDYFVINKREVELDTTMYAVVKLEKFTSTYKHFQTFSPLLDREEDEEFWRLLLKKKMTWITYLII
ncbi:hypothetical protein NWE61_06910 [Mycoplasmopsis felis]|nr:hypothetical protein [Mycoplasmopsis felis]MCU9934775.1 hypothetical protein [Mycoplasmopsis felis]